MKTAYLVVALTLTLVAGVFANTAGGHGIIIKATTITPSKNAPANGSRDAFVNHRFFNAL